MPAYTEETFFNIRNKCSQEQWTQYATEILEFDSYPALSDVCRDPKFANSADYSIPRRVSRMDNGVAVTQNSVLDEMSSNMDMGKTYEIFPQGSGKTSKRGSIVSEKDREKFRSSFVMQDNEGSSDDEFIPVERLSTSRHNASTTDKVPKADSNEQPVLVGPSTSNGSNSNQLQEDQHLPAYDVGMDHEHKLQEMEDLMSTLNNADEMLCSILKKIDDALQKGLHCSAMNHYPYDTFMKIRSQVSQVEWEQYAMETLNFDRYPALGNVSRVTNTTNPSQNAVFNDSTRKDSLEIAPENTRNSEKQSEKANDHKS
ncbi:hypothetical protein Ddc_16783 [Ditylenchus destructor]|nr:hypothetical protein Ddc_16783 [Ditylenchus destructor]